MRSEANDACHHVLCQLYPAFAYDCHCSVAAYMAADSTQYVYLVCCDTGLARHIHRV